MVVSMEPLVRSAPKIAWAAAGFLLKELGKMGDVMEPHLGSDFGNWLVGADNEIDRPCDAAGN